MALIDSDQVSNRKYTPDAAPHSAREVHVVKGKASLTDSLAADDLVRLVSLPANCIPVDCVLISTDLDANGTPTIDIDVGILNSDKDDLVSNSELIDGSDVCQAGGTKRMDSPNCVFNPATWLAESDCPDIMAEKFVAMKVNTVAATPAAGTVYFLLFYRSAENGV